MQGPIHDGDLNVDFPDIQNLQILTDKVHQISQILGVNIDVGHQIQKFGRRLEKSWFPLDSLPAWVFDDFDAKIDEFLFAHRNHKSRIDSILQRSKDIFGLVHSNP